jgi:hypothetical protein
LSLECSDFLGLSKSSISDERFKTFLTSLPIELDVLTVI